VHIVKSVVLDQGELRLLAIQTFAGWHCVENLANRQLNLRASWLAILFKLRNNRVGKRGCEMVGLAKGEILLRLPSWRDAQAPIDVALLMQGVDYLLQQGRFG
jgi:hypothetical protein